MNHAQGFTRYGAGSGSEQELTFCHEAGFDAYMTGVVFARLLWLHGAREADAATGDKRLHPLKGFANRVFLMRTDMPYAALSGPNPAAKRSHVVYVSGLPAGTTNRDIWRACDALGRITVRWLSAGCCFLAFLDGVSQGGQIVEEGVEERVRTALERLPQAEGLTVQTYAQWEAGNVGAFEAEAVDDARPAKRQREDRQAVRNKGPWRLRDGRCVIM